MDVEFVKKKITETSIVKSAGIFLIKVSQKRLQEIFMICLLMLNVEFDKSFLDSNAFHN